MIARYKHQFESACNIFIRPPKYDYELEELGKNPLQIKNSTIYREDLTLKNSEQKTLQCSFFQIQDESHDPKPCIIYLHCNAGSRCEVLPILSYLVTIGINVFSFDMSGCGLSEGDYVTLGYKECDDVKIVIDYLQTTMKVSTIGIWGRSMGAVTALKYAELNRNISVLIIDSPFSNLNKLAYELAKEKTGIPSIFLPIVLGLVKKGIKKKVYIKFGALDLTKFVHNIKIPACFLFSFHDEIIKPYHIEKLFELYGSPEKRLISIKGRHNDPRPANILKELAKYCFDQFLKNDEAFKKKMSQFENFDIYKKYNKILKKPDLELIFKELDDTENKKHGLSSSSFSHSLIKDEWEIPQISEEFPRVLSNVSLLSQNDAKFLLKENIYRSNSYDSKILLKNEGKNNSREEKTKEKNTSTTLKLAFDDKIF